MHINKNNLSPSRRIAYGAVFSALCVLCLYLSHVLPYGKLVFLIAPSVILSLLASFTGVFVAVIGYICSGLLGWVITGSIPLTAYYSLFFGLYPIVKLLAEQINSVSLRWVVKGVFATTVFAVIAFGIKFLLPDIDIPLVGELHPVAKFIAIFTVGIALFTVFDIVLTYVIYYTRKTLKRFNIG